MLASGMCLLAHGKMGLIFQQEKCSEMFNSNYKGVLMNTLCKLHINTCHQLSASGEDMWARQSYLFDGASLIFLLLICGTKKWPDTRHYSSNNLTGSYCLILTSKAELKSSLFFFQFSCRI